MYSSSVSDGFQQKMQSCIKKKQFAVMTRAEDGITTKAADSAVKWMSKLKLSVHIMFERCIFNIGKTVQTLIHMTIVKRGEKNGEKNGG